MVDPDRTVTPRRSAGPSRTLAIFALLGGAMATILMPGRGAPTQAAYAATPLPVTTQPPAAPAPVFATPAVVATPQPGPSLPVPTATPAGVLVRFAGQILDVAAGFVFFTTGDGFRMAPDVRYVDYKTGGPTTLVAKTRTYARASFDPASGRVTELSLSRSPIPAEASYEEIKRFAIVASAPKTNPELAAKEGITGRPVLVTFTVLVPTSTQLADIVYMQTDQSGWAPNAIRLDRIDALHYRVTLRLASGTNFLYRYTRGSTQSVESGRNGMEIKPRALIVQNLDAKNQDDIVYNWSDQNPAGNGPPGPDSIPTPFNPNGQPFPVPFPSRPTLPPKPPPH